MVANKTYVKKIGGQNKSVKVFVKTTKNPSGKPEGFVYQQKVNSY